MEKLLNILRNHPLFAGMDEQTLIALSSKTIMKSFSSGEMIIHQGENQNDLFIIGLGKVEVIVIDKDNDTNLTEIHHISTLIAGQTIGELSFIDRKPRSASVRALEDCTLYILPGEEFRKDATVQAYRAISMNLAESLRKTNEITVQSLKSELKKTKQSADAGLFVTYGLLALVGYMFTTNILRKLVVNPQTSMFASTPLILIMAILFFWMIKHFNYPYHNFGLTLKNSKNGIKDAIIASILFCLLLTLIKWALVNYVPDYSQLTLFTNHNLSTNYAIFRLVLSIILYGLFVPLQEFIARGVFQSSLEDLFLAGNAWKANILASAIFAALHIHISPHLAMVIFVPSLLWGWLYTRHQTLIAPIVSHIIIGWWAIFALGLEKILINA